MRGNYATKEQAYRLRRLLKFIEPRIARFDMDEGVIIPAEVSADVKAGSPECGTVFCMAGGEVVRANRGKRLGDLVEELGTALDYELGENCIIAWPNVAERAAASLGLPLSEAEFLFFTHNWPRSLEAEYNANRAKLRKTKGKGIRQALEAQAFAILKERVEWFIKEGE